MKIAHLFSLLLMVVMLTSCQLVVSEATTVITELPEYVGFRVAPNLVNPIILLVLFLVKVFQSAKILVLHLIILLIKMNQ